MKDEKYKENNRMRKRRTQKGRDKTINRIKKSKREKKDEKKRD